MGKKSKKKGKGAEKTLLKTDKKANAKLRKELASKGEEDVQVLIQQSIEEHKILPSSYEETVPPPSKRSSFSLVVHPEKDLLILFGGEYYSGSQVEIYNDLFFYNIKHDRWSKFSSCSAPPPRASHQAVTVAQSGGQLWVFGGEFTSPSQSQIYHYNDLWAFHLNNKVWERVISPGAPSSRSGHKMVAFKRMLIVFGGFYDNLHECRYFNDVYAFDIDNRAWKKLELSGICPNPRSGCCMVSFADKILVYGGYSKEKIKKDSEKGIVHVDMFLLYPDITICGKKESLHRRRRRKASTGNSMEEVTVGNSSSIDESVASASSVESPKEIFTPTQRMRPGLVIHKGTLFLYGGIYEEGNRQITLNDFYAIDLNKLDEWKTIIPLAISGSDWVESESSSESDESEEMEDEETSDSDDDCEEMDVD